MYFNVNRVQCNSVTLSYSCSLVAEISAVMGRERFVNKQNKADAKLSNLCFAWWVSPLLWLLSNKVYTLHTYIKPVFRDLPEPNRAWLLLVYFSR